MISLTLSIKRSLLGLLAATLITAAPVLAVTPKHEETAPKAPSGAKLEGDKTPDKGKAAPVVDKEAILKALAERLAKTPKEAQAILREALAKNPDLAPEIVAVVVKVVPSAEVPTLVGLAVHLLPAQAAPITAAAVLVVPTMATQIVKAVVTEVPAQLVAVEAAAIGVVPSQSEAIRAAAVASLAALAPQGTPLTPTDPSVVSPH